MSDFSTRLVAWQRQFGRHDLPWIGSRDPYRVWLSEIMLQQTQVATVRAYYLRFLDRFPSVQQLAAAPLDEVLALWAGLGYYTRARNLHACAQAVAALGDWPRSAAELEQLPGIGRSTARAIAAFCFGERLSILDGNVRRVLSRLLAFDEDLSGAAAQRRLWLLADALVPAQASDMQSYTQGLMDLGASLCAAKKPRCADCPVSGLCLARAQGREAELPIRSKRLKRGQRENWWLWLRRAGDGAIWLQQRPTPGVWAGLWTLPLFDSEAAAEQVAGGAPLELLPRIEHALTHFDWVLHPRRADWVDEQAPLPEGRWVAAEQLAGYGLPAPFEEAGGWLSMGERWDWLAEGTLCLSLAPPAEVSTQRRLLDLARRLAGTPGMIDCIPGVHSLSLIADPARLPALELERLAQAAWRRARPARETRQELRVPVQYGGDGGPDLADASRLAGLSPAQLVEAHAAPRYEVACLGFLPGFAYLLGLPSALHLPRRDAPRLRVPSGSVGIGGAQTGIYPLDSPGGWQLIGHTRLAMFDAARSPATLLLPGDWLRFEPLRDA